VISVQGVDARVRHRREGDMPELDWELLRELAAAKEMRQLELKYLHRIAADEQRGADAEEDQRRRLHAVLFPTSPREAQ
jgi:hypothetical protein